ncbi:SRPBCC family protein [Mangrovihabitans endophyticus]|uniref:Cyclase n=1 Tax=Mangrovihabitans endophyticus TaxID=1751298 RepID=A0A8J3FME4_9ACTN|nr:SRPBCC family protein [Mangrovihabitans endophyticus]GGK83046.1 cyclase [Mangrovihabitans endophyticus]
MSLVQQSIEVGAPVHNVYEKLAAFENYPQFMTGVQRVTPTGADQTHWVLDVDGRRREFDATITERTLDERVSWCATGGPLLAETLTLRPMGETRTQVVAQLEADIAFLMPGDKHGQETLNRRLKHDLTTLKTLVEQGSGQGVPRGGASTKNLSGNSTGAGGNVMASPADVAARLRERRVL